MSGHDSLDPTFMPTTREGQIAQQLKIAMRRIAVLERKSINALSIPVGSLVARPASAVPTGFLLCDGTAVSRVDYGELFALLNADGLPHGAGNGSTTFNLPDFRGRTIVGVGTHVDVNSLLDNDGLAVGSRTPRHNHSETPHSHPFSTPNHAHTMWHKHTNELATLPAITYAGNVQSSAKVALDQSSAFVAVGVDHEHNVWDSNNGSNIDPQATSSDGAHSGTTGNSSASNTGSGHGAYMAAHVFIKT